jgi:antitoxin HicB
VAVFSVTLIPDDNGTLLVTSPDFPELTSFGETVEDSLERARGALLEAIAARIHDREPIPPPSRGCRRRLRSRYCAIGAACAPSRKPDLALPFHAR